MMESITVRHGATGAPFRLKRIWFYVLVMMSTILCKVTVGVMNRQQSSMQHESSASAVTPELVACMAKFNVPNVHVHGVWSKSGTTVGSDPEYKMRLGGAAGVFTQYASMTDGTSSKYCLENDAVVDTLTTVGSRVQASGTCPVYGKFIQFSERDGTNAVEFDRYRNEIRGRVFPLLRDGDCPVNHTPGQSEVPKRLEGLGMYHYFNPQCPLTPAVWNTDFVKDDEFDDGACSQFLSLQSPMKATTGTWPNFELYSYHGNSGRDVYSVFGKEGLLSACPPYETPTVAPPMLQPSVVHDEFTCSQLSRCLRNCWPHVKGGRCFKGLPAIFNRSTGECLILGYHTQYYTDADCISSSDSDISDNDENYFCMRPMKSEKLPNVSYLSDHIRQDYRTACPPREMLAEVAFGIANSFGECTPLKNGLVLNDVTPERCGKFLFENSKSDDTKYPGKDYYLATWRSTQSSCKDSSCALVDGSCEIFKETANCLAPESGVLSMTSLTDVTASPAISPPTECILPLDLCTNVVCLESGFCDHQTGECVCPAGFLPPDCSRRCPCVHGNCDASGNCVCDSQWTGAICDTPECPCLNNKPCKADGSCDCLPTHIGQLCETPCPCQNGGVCLENGICNCLEGFIGEMCQTVCPCQNGGTCDENGNCSCPDAFLGDLCEIPCPCQNGGECKNGVCQCPTVGGPYYLPLCSTNQCNCQNGGTCNVQGGCDCPPTHKGLTCEDPCPCLNSGTCDISGECVCLAEWTGGNCQIACLCRPNGTCSSDGQCQCDEGFWGSNCEHACGCLNGSKCLTDHSCECGEGYYGNKCENQCLCQNSATCESDGTCTCKSGYYGDRCQSECNCENGGMCESDGTCTCLSGFYGDKCQEICECLNNAMCESDGACTCRPGFNGARCEYECLCQNDGTCESDGQCTCKAGFYGYKCENQCLCQNDATCESSGRCTCKSGFYGYKCENVCTCQNDGTCESDGTCTCKSGFYGANCENVCTCQNGGVCKSDGSCTCLSGFYGDNCENVCTCQNGGMCESDGSCTCLSGFYGDNCENQEESFCNRLTSSLPYCVADCQEGCSQHYQQCSGSHETEQSTAFNRCLWDLTLKDGRECCVDYAWKDTAKIEELCEDIVNPNECEVDCRDTCAQHYRNCVLDNINAVAFSNVYQCVWNKFDEDDRQCCINEASYGSIWAIAGGIIGGVMLLGGLGIWFMKSKTKSGNSAESSDVNRDFEEGSANEYVRSDSFVEVDFMDYAETKSPPAAPDPATTIILESDKDENPQLWQRDDAVGDY